MEYKKVLNQTCGEFYSVQVCSKLILREINAEIVPVYCTIILYHTQAQYRYIGYSAYVPAYLHNEPLFCFLNEIVKTVCWNTHSIKLCSIMLQGFYLVFSKSGWITNNIFGKWHRCYFLILWWILNLLFILNWFF